MDFTKLEDLGKQLFAGHPRIRRILKRGYHMAGRLLSRDRIRSQGSLIRVTPRDGWEYFYGYYDKSPWDRTDRYLLALKARCTYRRPAPQESASLVLLDTRDSCRVHPLAVTRAWNVQQGCMAQWLGPDFHSRILYNDFRSGNYCSVILRVKDRAEEAVLPLPVYDAARDGSYALSLDFSRLHRLRPGYGYSNLPDRTANDPCPDSPCIWKMDLHTGEAKPLLTYRDLASFEPVPSMADAEHKVNHLMIRPDGQRFMVLHRWLKNGRKYTRLVTADCEGKQLFNLSDEDFVSHCYWKNNREILSFLRKEPAGTHYYLLRDQSPSCRMLWPSLNRDGHCSCAPDKDLVVTDTYPDHRRIAAVFLCRENDPRPKVLARVFSPFRYDNDCRCDLHPRWNRAGDTICIDSVHEGKRAMYLIPVSMPSPESHEPERSSHAASHPNHHPLP